ncbi:MAG: hypothetical protein IT185_12005, partial [Acidobacteria bacterium]|nr:hypothetical protein [Acidobacteriota bacterium]
GIECDKSICADLTGDGDCADPADLPASADLGMSCGVNDEFPISLIYTFNIDNTGETALVNSQACDPDLVADALAAGAIVGPCDLCTGACDGIDDACADLGTLARQAGPTKPTPTNGPYLPTDEVGTLKYVASNQRLGNATATCTITFPTVESWENFAAADGGDVDCHSNSLTATADVDTAGLCIRDADTELTSTCGAQACVAPPCVLDVEKTVRCVDNCAGLNPDAGVDLLEALPGATVEFVIVASNIGLAGDPAICTLEFTDTLTGPYVDCVQECSAQLINGGANPVCVLPPGTVRTDGVPFELDLSAACGAVLAPGDELRIACTCTVAANASGQILNSV